MPSSLHALDDRGNRAAIVVELLGAVVHAEAGASADVLVMGALVGVLEMPPTADVVNKHDRAIRLSTSDVPDEPLRGIAAIDAQTFFSGVGARPNDFHSMARGALANGLTRVFDGVLLGLGKHWGVLSGADGGDGVFGAVISRVVVYTYRAVDTPVPAVGVVGRGATVQIWDNPLSEYKVLI